jgi:cytochrome c551/c552
MHPLLKLSIALVCVIFLGLSGYWIVEIVQNLRSITSEPLVPATTTTIQVIPTPTTPIEQPLETEAEQAAYKNVKTSSFLSEGGTVTLIHQCAGELSALTHPQTGARVQICRGLNRLVLKRLDGKYQVLEVVDAKSDADMPLLTYVTQTVQNGDHIIMIFERNGCPVNREKCSETGFRAMTHALQIEKAKFSRLSAYPSRSRPTWNSDGSKALFVTQTCGSTRCDAAPLVGYDLLKDAAARLTQEEGANEDYARDVTGVKLGYWRSVSWVTSSEWSATFVNASGIAKVLTGALE